MKLLDKKAMRKNQHLLTDDQKDSQEEGKNWSRCYNPHAL
jgi:hypothetical protein